MLNPLFIKLCITTLIGIIIGIVLLIKSIIYSRKNRSSAKLKYTLIYILLVIIATASWILNFGWIRLSMTLLAVPIIHTIAFMIINNFSLSYIDKSVKLKRYIVLTYITYLVAYLLLPDCGDVAPMYVFFGLIHNDIVAGISSTISPIVFIGNIVFLVLQIVETNRTKKRSIIS